MSDPAFDPVDLTELVESGVLMAANERFFWPLGLALTWTRDEEGAMSDLHVREWTYSDGHHESIEDSGSPIAIERRAAFAIWFDRRAESMPADEAERARLAIDPWWEQT